MLKGYYDGTQGNRIKITRRPGIQHPNAFALPRQLDINLNLSWYRLMSFISFPQKKRSKERCPAICFILGIYPLMGRKLFSLIPIKE